MNRRNVLIGLTAAATGSSVVFGSGAFTQVQADRSLTIGVSEDDDALLALDAGDNIESVYNDDADDNDVSGTGELVINTNELTESSDSNGFNVGAIVQIGQTSGDNPSDNFSQASVPTDNRNNVAFVLTNNFDNVPGSSGSDTIDVNIDLSNVSDGSGTLTFIGTTSDNTSKHVQYDSDGSGGDVTYTLGTSDEIYFSIVIETTSTTSPADFGGAVTITAEPESEDA